MTHYLINSPNKKVRPVMFLSMMVIEQMIFRVHVHIETSPRIEFSLSLSQF